MENRKGNGIFLGIVSVATLIVAIIGATFAYFSATTESNLDAVNLTAYEFKLSLSVSPIYPEGASALIPLNPTTKIKTDENKFIKYDEEGKLVSTEEETEGMNNLQYAINEAAKRCIDDKGLQVCSLYQIRIENQTVNGLTLNGQLKTVTNKAGEGDGKTSFSHLTYQGVTGDHETRLTLEGEPETIKAEPEGVINISDIEVSGATYDEDGELVPGVGTGYILIYLNDDGDQSSEMGASFTGQVIYSSGSEGTTKLTGTFSVSAPEKEPTDEPTGE